ncbi:hypothetical protein FGO68_gene4285 [Halteria grandinella]|uniref:Uncharacterized protein n=1 Tax=Halteria grandinella TaxID=5974 RepID=A0A8J8NT01_HALGN|nr:hypothetical protein FGO68_gene4285 [Halteria grandinella]
MPQKALKEAMEAIIFDIDHVEFEVFYLTYDLFQEFKKFAKFRVSKKLTHTWYDSSLENNLEHLQEVAACAEVKLRDLYSIRPVNIRNAKEFTESMRLPMAVKSINLEGLDSPKFDFVDSLDTVPEQQDAHTTKIIFDVHGIQSERFFKLLTYLLHICTKVTELTLKFRVGWTFKHFPLQVDKTGLKLIHLQQWDPTMTFVNELLEKSNDTLEVLELKDCKQVSLQSLRNSKVLKELYIMQFQGQEAFANENEGIITTFSNLEIIEGCNETALMLSKHYHLFKKLKRLTLYKGKQIVDISWLYQPVPFTLNYISVEGLDVRKYFKVNKSERVEVSTTADNLKEAKELMQEYPKTKFNFKMKYSSTYDLIGAVDSLNRKVYQAQYKCIVM